MKISIPSTINIALEADSLPTLVDCEAHGLLNQQTGYCYFTHLTVAGLPTRVSCARLTPDECSRYLNELERSVKGELAV